MENFEEDIRNFDRLEQGDLKNDPVLQSINQLDALMQKTSVKAPQEDFVGRVMSSAVVAIRKRKQFRFFTTLAGVMVALFVVLFMALSGQSGSLPALDIAPVTDQMGRLTAVFANEKFRQLFLIIEAIVVLLIVDQVLAKFQFGRTSAH